MSEAEPRSFIDIANEACLDARLLSAIEHALMPVSAACNAVIELPGFGRFDLGLCERLGVLVVRVHCHTSRGHAWLEKHRFTLGQHLAARTGMRVRLSTSAPR